MTITTGTHQYTEALPDLPDIIHGIKQIGEVWATQCDNCHTVHASEVPVLACRAVTFNPRLASTPEKNLRLCTPCWSERGGNR